MILEEKRSMSRMRLEEQRTKKTIRANSHSCEKSILSKRAGDVS
jgi:hypothetical protein